MPNTNCSQNLKRYLHRQNQDLITTLKDAIRNREVRDDDYPKVAVACEYDIHRAFGHSHKCHSSIMRSVSYVKPLKDALIVFGKPPTIKTNNRTGRILYIGTCAEDSAANQVLEKYYARTRRYPKLNTLVFTNPIRVRTCQRKKFCDVCKTIF